MKSRGPLFAMSASLALHGGLISLWQSAPMVESDSSPLYSTNIEAILIEDASTAGETPELSKAAVETSPSEYRPTQMEQKLVEEVSRLTALADTLNTRLESVTQSHHADVAALRQEQDETDARNEALTRQVAVEKTAYQVLSEKHEERLSELAAGQAEANALRATIDRQDKILRDLSGAHDVLMTANDRLISENETLMAAHTEESETHQAHEALARAQISKLENALSQALSENDALRRSLEESAKASSQSDVNRRESGVEKIASAASLQTGNAVTDVRPIPTAGNPKPVYPKMAIRRGLEGDVSLQVKISESGAVDAIFIEKASGYAILDEAAVASVRKWRFTPALKDGQPSAAVTIIPVQFRLIDARG